jgi:hypothetical protein
MAGDGDGDGERIATGSWDGAQLPMETGEMRRREL